MQGPDSDGGLWYEYEMNGNRLVKEKAFLAAGGTHDRIYNAWQITGDERYLKKSLSAWQFVQDHIPDEVDGEGFWE